MKYCNGKYIRISYDKINYITDGIATVKCKLNITFSHENNVIDKSYFVGVAKLKKEDKFDFEVGKRVALAKAELKAYKALHKICRSIINHRRKVEDILYNTVSFCSKQITHNEDYLKTEQYLKVVTAEKEK